MDNSSCTSELIESLDFLRPPVKRISKNIIVDNRTKSNNVLKDLSKKISNEAQYNKRGVEPSTSLILKRTTEREILEQFAVLGNTGLFSTEHSAKSKINEIVGTQEKPLIKVTVIPKSTHIHVSNTFRKRKPVGKKLRATVSNHENSILAKNLYLVLAGRKKDKVYEIKTTASVKLANTNDQYHWRYEGMPLEQISSLKLVLESLNMDQKIERDRTKMKRLKNVDVLTDNKLEYSNLIQRQLFRQCNCTDAMQDNNVADVISPKNCVRITGRLGINEGDQYVLRYAATVNEKLVGTDFNQELDAMETSTTNNEQRYLDNYFSNCAKKYRIQRDSNIQVDMSQENPRIVEPNITKTITPRFTEMCNCPIEYYGNSERNLRKQKDFVMQTNISQESSRGRETMNDWIVVNTKNTSKGTQGTQVNHDIDFKILHNVIQNYSRIKDEFVQCQCANTDTNVKENKPTVYSDSDNKDLKRSKSPLVVISVYPSEKGSESVKVVTNSQIDNNGFISQKGINFIENTQKDLFKAFKRNNKDINNTTRSPRPLSRSPQKRYKSNTNIADRLLRSNKRKTSPARELNTVTTNRTTRQVRLNQDKANSNRYEIKTGTKNNKVLKKEHKSTNTEHNETKKLLIDNYTKQLTAFLNKDNIEKEYKVPLNDSKVAINIDGENEYYDVLLGQGNKTTDLNVRKTFKVAGKQENISHGGVSNFSPKPNNSLLIPETSKKQSESQSVYKKKPVNAATLDKFSGLRVRDSIEISHRRGENNEFTNKSNKRSKGKNKQLFGKHYRGDSCLIADPIKRDQEIRTLLGIDKGRHTTTASEFPVKKIFDRSLRCNYDENCNNLIIASSENVVHIPTSPLCVCCDIKGNQYSRNINVQSGSSPSLKNVKCKCKLTSRKHDVLCECPLYSGSKKYLDSVPKSAAAQAKPIKRDIQGECYLEKKSSSNTGKKNVQYECHIPTPLDSKQTNKSSSKISVSIDSKRSIAKTGTQYEESPVHRTSLYQQLILNRNIQVFLQVEQFSQQKPIILSRKQYDKVKRTIENTISNKSNKRKRCICKTSLISVGDVRKKTKQKSPQPYDKDTQTLLAYDNSNIQNSSSRSSKRSRQHNTYVLFSKDCKVNDKSNITPRQAASSVEIRCTSMSYTKHVTFSSTNVEAGSIATALTQKDSLSLHTIFRGRRRCPTPNLGTSVYSLNSEEDNDAHSIKPINPAPDNKQRKPFLRRLMSCLVMRTVRVTEANPLKSPPLKQPSESTIDSYHISTSLGAVELTSSMYDTSASFYTNHSVYPVNSKMKRGFFSSVREFLTSRKS